MSIDIFTDLRLEETGHKQVQFKDIWTYLWCKRTSKEPRTHICRTAWKNCKGEICPLIDQPELQNSFASFCILWVGGLYNLELQQRYSPPQKWDSRNFPILSATSISLFFFFSIQIVHTFIGLVHICGACSSIISGGQVDELPIDAGQFSIRPD